MKQTTCDICGKFFPILDKHHIQSKSKGGTNSKSNICYIRPDYHRLVHTGAIIIEGWFDTTGGKKLIWRLKNESSITEIKDPDVFIINSNSWNKEKTEQLILNELEEVID